MSMPKHSTSYEQTFHLLLELLASPQTTQTVQIPQSSETAAFAFRLRYYAFQRTLLAEATRELAEALKIGDATGAEEARGKKNKVLRSKRFTATIRPDPNTTNFFVIFSDRDAPFSSINDMLLGQLSSQQSQLATSATQAKQAFTQTLRNSDAELMELLTPQHKTPSHSTPHPPAVEDPYVEATRDIPPTKHSLDWEVEQSFLLLKLGKASTFTRDITNPEEQQTFIQSLNHRTSQTPDFPTYFTEASPTGVHIIRE